MKYEITDIAHPINPNLHRIRALRDIPSQRVKEGDLGGWIEKESNLSQECDCWVGEDAQVYGEAEVYGNAWVRGSASCLLYTSPSPRDRTRSRMPSSA